MAEKKTTIKPKAVKVEKTKVEKPEAKSESKKAFDGKYITAIGRRKSATAQIRMYSAGNGLVLINNLPLEKYFNTLEQRTSAKEAIRLAGADKKDWSIMVKGGGKDGQAEAVRHGMARALVKENEELRKIFKAVNLLSRDARKKERKKPGLKKARRAPQWSKR